MIWRVDLSANGERFATAGDEGLTKIVDTRTGAGIASLKDEGQATDVVIDASGTLAATIIKRVVRLIWLDNSRQPAKIKHDDVNRIALSQDGSLLATGTWDGDVRILRTSDQHVLARVWHRNKVVRELAFSPDGSLLATASDDGVVRLLESRTGREVAFVKHGSGVKDVAFSGDGQLLATASSDNKARIVSTRNGKVVLTIKHGTRVWAVTLNYRGDRVATGGAGVPPKVVKIWKIEGLPPVATP